MLFVVAKAMASSPRTVPSCDLLSCVLGMAAIEELVDGRQTRIAVCVASPIRKSIHILDNVPQKIFDKTRQLSFIGV